MNFERFENIEHRPLRTYNRVVMAHNLLEELGEDTVRQYLEGFDEVERKEMYVMQLTIKALGKDRVQKEVTKGLVIEEDTDDQE